MHRLVFCMFAEDVGLLPDDMFTRMLRHARRQPEQFATAVSIGCIIVPPISLDSSLTPTSSGIRAS